MTPNPIHALRITNYSTKNIKNTKTHFKQSKLLETFRILSSMFSFENCFIVYIKIPLFFILYILYILYI